MFGQKIVPQPDLTMVYNDWVCSFAHPGFGAFVYPTFLGLGELCSCKIKPKGLFGPAMKLSCFGTLQRKGKEKCAQPSQGFSLDMALLGRERSCGRTYLLSEQSFHDIALSRQEHL